MKAENDILDEGLSVLEGVLDRHRIAHHKAIGTRMNHRGYDAEVRLPEIGRTLLVEAKSTFRPKQVAGYCHDFCFNHDDESLIPLVITRRISENAFDCCIENDVGVIDLNRNIYLELPGVCIERFRERRDEKRRGTSGTVFSAKASRIVRALLARPCHLWQQSELVEDTGVTQGYVSQIVDRMQSDAYILHIGKVIRLVEPDCLLDDWLSHYRFDRHTRTKYAMSFSTYDDGLRKFADEMAHLGIGFAFTGWSGAHLMAPYGIPPAITAYVREFPEQDKSSILFSVPQGQDGNVVLYRPQDEGVFQFLQNGNDVPVVSAAQLYLDLSRMPGRAKEQAGVIRENLLYLEDN